MVILIKLMHAIFNALGFKQIQKPLTLNDSVGTYVCVHFLSCDLQLGKQQLGGEAARRTG
jgi:ABC-type microcin C transport system permease subunit YejE